MPVLHSAIHKIDKKPDGTHAALILGGAEQGEIQAREEFAHRVNLVVPEKPVRFQVKTVGLSHR